MCDSKNQSQKQCYDYTVAIIGGGVIGCFIARELSKYDISACVIEKHSDVCEETSKANSGIVHAGFDAAIGSNKAKFNVEGNRIMGEICEELDVPFKRNGSMILAFSDEEKETLKDIYERGLKNGVPELEIMSGDEARKLEPSISEKVVAVLRAGTGGIVCPFRLTIHAYENAKENGVDFLLDNTVEKIEKTDSFTVYTSKSEVKCKYIINAAGVFADQISEMAGDKSFSIYPRRGEYMLYDKKLKGLVSHTLFHTPTKQGKGILVTPTVDGNILIGPNAMNSTDKLNKDTTKFGLDTIFDGARKSVPSISKRDVITSFTGLRAIADTDDFVIKKSDIVPNLIHTAGMQSPGLSSAPAVGKYIAELVCELEDGLSVKENYSPKLKKKIIFERLSVDELNELILKNSSYSNVICRCETVSEGEIIDAIKSGAKDVDGIKRRTRAGAGRCQGGFCMPKVMEILSRELDLDITQINKNDDGSYILVGKTKGV